MKWNIFKQKKKAEENRQGFSMWQFYYQRWLSRCFLAAKELRKTRKKEGRPSLEENPDCIKMVGFASDECRKDGNEDRCRIVMHGVRMLCHVDEMSAIALVTADFVVKFNKEAKEQRMKNKTISKQENFDGLAKEFEKVYKDYFTGETGHTEQDMLGIYFIPISADSDDLYIQQDRLTRTIEFFTALRNLQVKYQEDIVIQSLYQRNGLGEVYKNTVLKVWETAGHKIRVCFGTTLEERFGIIDIVSLLKVALGLFDEVGKRIAEREQIKKELVKKEHYLDFTQDTYFDNDNKEVKLPEQHFAI